MLNSMRKKAGGWVAHVFIGLLVLSFAVWGINDIFGGRSTSVVAVVGDEEVLSDVFDAELQRALKVQSDRTGTPVTPQDAMASGLTQAVLNRMTTDKVIDVEANKLGLGISDEAVAREIREDPVFKGPFGSFDKNQFLQLLYQNRFTEEMYVDRVRADLRRVQLLSAVLAGITAPNLIADSQYRFLQEARAIKYILLPPELVGAIETPSEEALTNYYETHKLDYMAPEYRAISLLQLSPKDLTADIEVSEEDARAEYDIRINDYSVPERRSVAQLSFSTRADAAAAAERLREGAGFMEIAEENGFGPEDVNLGTVTRDELVGDEIAAAAFELQTAGIAGPVDGPLGSAILRVSEIQPGVIKPYNAVKAELRTLIALDRAADEILDLSNLVEDERAAGTSFEEISTKFGLTLLSNDGVTTAGLEAGGETWSLAPNLLATAVFVAFNSDVGQENDMIEQADGSVFWLRVNGVTPSQLRPLGEVRDGVAIEWREDTMRRRLQSLASKLAERGNGGEPFDQIGAELDRGLLSTPKPLVRWFSDDTFSLQAVSQVFSTPAGKFTYGPVNVGNSVVLMQVSEIVVPDLAQRTDVISAMAEQIKNDLGNDLASEFISGLRAKTNVHVNTQALDTLYGDSPG